MFHPLRTLWVLVPAVMAGLAGWWIGGAAVPLVHLAAWCVALGLVAFRGHLTLPRPALAPVGKALLTTFVVLGALRMGFWRARVGLEGYEAGVIIDHDMAWLQAWVLDEGLPSYLHSLAIAPATWVGGVGVVFVLHTTLYALFGALVLDTTRRVAPTPPAQLVIGVLMLAPTVLHQFVELRSYATYLTAVALGANALVPRREGGVPAYGTAVLAFGLASLDNPLAGMLLGAVGVAIVVSLRLDAREPTERAHLNTALQAAAIVMGAACGSVLTALSVHQPNAPSFATPYGPMAALAALACVLTLGLSHPPLRSSRIVALFAVCTLGVLWARGHLAVEGRYVLFLLPLALPLVLHAVYRLDVGRLGEVASWLALGATLMLWTATREVGVPAVPAPGSFFSLLDHLALALGGLACTALIVATVFPRRSPGAVRALPWLLGAWGLTTVLWSWSAEDQIYGAITCTERHLGLAVRTAGDDLPLCIADGRIRPVWYAWARYQERPSVWAPLRRAASVGLPERIVHTCPSEAHVRVVTWGDPDPEGCTALPAPHEHTGLHTVQVWTCAAR